MEPTTHLGKALDAAIAGPFRQAASTRAWPIALLIALILAELERLVMIFDRLAQGWQNGTLPPMPAAPPRMHGKALPTTLPAIPAPAAAAHRHATPRHARSGATHRALTQASNTHAGPPAHARMATTMCARRTEPASPHPGPCHAVPRRVQAWAQSPAGAAPFKNRTFSPPRHCGHNITISFLSDPELTYPP